MGLPNVEQRFKSLLAEAGTVAAEVHAALMDAAVRINKAVDGEHPVLFSIIQHLEMAAHLAVSSPALIEPPSSAANPTQAEPASEASSANTDPQPPTTSDDSATESKGSSAS